MEKYGKNLWMHMISLDKKSVAWFIRNIINKLAGHAIDLELKQEGVMDSTFLFPHLMDC